jgi:single-stranded DNA-binding protein
VSRPVRRGADGKGPRDRNLAGGLPNYLSKGLLVAVQGRLAIKEWTAQDGNKRRSYYVVGDQIENYGRTTPPEGAAARPDATPTPGTTAREETEEYQIDPFADA